jgi:hypothetical protein
MIDMQQGRTGQPQQHPPHPNGFPVIDRRTIVLLQQSRRQALGLLYGLFQSPHQKSRYNSRGGLFCDSSHPIDHGSVWILPQPHIPQSQKNDSPTKIRSNLGSELSRDREPLDSTGYPHQ